MKFTFMILTTAIFGFVSQASTLGNGKKGEIKSASCSACHGPQGVSGNPIWPNLNGQKDLYLIKQLKAFKSGDRKDPLMTPISSTLTDEDIEDLAAYYTSLK